MGYQFEVLAPSGEEKFEKDVDPKEQVIKIARLKAESLHPAQHAENIILAADTIVVHQKKMLGKPADRKQAVDMLTQLSGQAHDVITGVCIMQGNHTFEFAETTTVFFRKLSASQIDYYIDNFNPFDKAGAYAIQEWIGLTGISRIEGCYFNVVGLPAARIYTGLSHFGIHPMEP